MEPTETGSQAASLDRNAMFPLNENHSATTWFGISNKTENVPKIPRCIRKESEPEEESFAILGRIFPHHSPSVLEMILKAYDNDIVRATESLMLENGMTRQLLTPPVSPENSSSTYFATKDSDSKSSHTRPSAFSPVPNNIVSYTSPAQVSALSPPIVQPFTPPAYPIRSIYRPYMFTGGNHFGMPYHPYIPPQARGMMVQSTNRRDARTCSRCSTWILPSDRFCSHCGKSA